MKNQYFGDENDYLKYGLLRALSNGGECKIGVCWMLTANDGRTDGKLINYLDDPHRWRLFDPPLFDLLKDWITRDGTRNIAMAESNKILPGAEFYTEFLEDTAERRLGYFKQMREKLAICDLIFYDPDNGIERKSIAKGKRDSAKYIYWDEITETFKGAHSILVYQHFPHEERLHFIWRTVKELETHLNASKVHWFRTTRVVYFLAAQAKHLDFFTASAAAVTEHWGSQIHCDK